MGQLRRRPNTCDAVFVGFRGVPARRLVARVEADLATFGNGNLSELEFEFQNEVEFSMHMWSHQSAVQFVCLET